MNHKNRPSSLFKKRWFAVEQPFRKRSQMRRLIVESLEDRRLFNVDWRNPVDSMDIDGDNSTSPLDVLAVVNYLNSRGFGAFPAVREPGQPFVDSDGDNNASPLDVLTVVNYLNVNSGGQRVLVESSQSIANDSSVTITLGQNTGTRNYRVKIDSQFDTTDKSTVLEDLLAVYLIDPDAHTTTLLDRGVKGTTLFALAGTQAEFIPDRVRWDGSILDIDLGDLAARDTGILKFQLLNNDRDTNTRITIQPLSNEIDLESIHSERLPYPSSPTVAGPETSLSDLTLFTNGQVDVRNVRFDSANGVYSAELRIRNDGDPLGRNIALALNELPNGVSLRNPSGTTPQGVPYLNLRPSVPRGGLTQGAWSAPVLIELDNPGRVPIAIKPTLFAAPNRAPTLDVISSLTVAPGGVLSLPLAAQDLDGDSITYSLVNPSVVSLPNVTIDASGVLTVRPAPSQLGAFQFDVVASDGVLDAVRTVTLNVVPDPITTTRVSGMILQVNGQPLANVPIQIGAVQGLTMADGSFVLNLGNGPVVSDTIKVRGELLAGAKVYPFIAEKLAFILDHEVYHGVKNVIERPIYLPEIDIANGKTIDPTKNTIVTSNALPGAKVEVAAGTLMNQQGTPFTGVLSMTEVPVNLTPAALPANLFADLVVTIQPGEMVFTTPTPLSLPNRGGYASGTILDLWSINPTTGEFDKVGLGRVSANGTVIDTINGGIRNSSWHFFGPPAPTGPKDEADPRNKKPEGCPFNQGATSVCEMHSGALLESHELVQYMSQGVSRGLTLTYDSLRVDPRPILHFTFDELNPNLYSIPSAVRLVAELDVNRNGFSREVPGYEGSDHGLIGNKNFWRLPMEAGSVDAALQIDLTDQPTGLYDYHLRSGMLGYAGARGFIGTLNETLGQVVSVNTIRSPLGAGWGIDGLFEIYENIDGTVLIINGDGSELLYTKNPDGTYQHPSGVFSTLNKLGDGTFKRTWPDQTVEQFNTARRISSVTDRNGNITRYFYDGDGRFVKYTDPVGLETTLVYSASQIEITDPVGRVTKLLLDSKGNLTQVTDPDGSSRRWRYDSQHRMTGEVDQLGNVETSNYGFHGRLTDVVRKDGSTRHYFPLDVQGLFPPNQTAADPLALPLSNPVAGRVPNPESIFADVNGNVTRSKLDQYGQVVSAMDKLGSLPSVVRNSDNLPTRITDELGNQQSLTYDERGNLLTRTVEPTDQRQSFGSAMRFDGIDDYVQISDAPPMRVVDVTLEAWVNFSALPIESIIVAKPLGNNGHDSYAIWYGYHGLRGAVSNGSGLASSGEIIAQWRPELGRWYHVAFTFSDETDSQTLYVDGEAIAIRSSVRSTIAYDSNPLAIGRNSNSGLLPRPFNGVIDEVRIWDRVRTKDEIRIDRVRRLVGDEPGLVAYYQFDQASGNQLTDSSPNRLDGISPLNEPEYVSPSVPSFNPVLAPTGLVSWWSGDGHTNDLAGGNHAATTGLNGYTFAPAMVGLGIVPSSGATVIVPDPDNSSLDIPNEMTIAAWINPNAFRYTVGIVHKGVVNGPEGVSYDLFLTDDGRLGFSSRKNGDISRAVYSTAKLESSSWTHVAVNITNDQLTFFFDGIADSVHTYPYERPNTNTPLLIGAQNWVYNGVSSPAGHFNGVIDEVQIFNRALASEEVRSIADAGQSGVSKPNYFDAASDFSLHSNPAGSWAYGYEAIEGNHFQPSTNTFTNGRQMWKQFNNGFGSSVGRGGERYYSDGNWLTLDPSSMGNSSIVQWTTPSAGTYLFNGRFQATPDTRTGKTRASVVVDSDSFETIVSDIVDLGPSSTSVVPFSFSKILAAGDVVSFVVKPHEGSFFETALFATVILEGSTLTGGTSNNSKPAITTYTYDPVFDQTTSFVDELGQKTIQTIDPNNGNVLSITEVVGSVGGADDRTLQYSYTPSGQIATVTDSLGRATQFSYDSLGRLTHIRRAAGTTNETVEQFQYDLAGRVTRTIDENGHQTQYTYDAMNRVISTSFADGSIYRNNYDLRGNLVKYTDALGNSSSQVFDRFDRPIKQIDAVGNTTTYHYDQVGNLTSIVDPLNNTTRTVYDARRRPVATVDTLGNTTSYRYDTKNQLVAVVDARGNKTSFEYDSRGNVSKTVDPLGKETLHKYDLSQQLIEQTDRVGRVIRYAYNELGELTTETWLNANGSTANEIRYSFDSVGQLQSANDSFSSIVYTRDELNRIQQEKMAGPNGIPTSFLNFTYDAIGNVLSQSDTINSVTGATNFYSFDNRNRITQLVQTGAGIKPKRVDFSYNALGQTSSIARFADTAGQLPVIATSFSFDTLNRTTNISHRNAINTVLNSFQFQYDATSRFTRITDIDGLTRYSYNTRDELIASDRTDLSNPNESYSYDATGNRTNSHLHGNSYVTGDGTAGKSDVNRLSSDGLFQYSYDANGNLSTRVEIASGKIREFIFDHRNRLVRVTDRPSTTDAATQVVKYIYDLFDRRIATNIDTTPADSVDGEITYFVYSKDDIIAELTDTDGSGPASPAVSTRYLHGPAVDQVMAQESANGDVHWMLTDHLGTVRDLVNVSGELVNHIKYDSFGNVIVESNPTIASRYKYTGREFDFETGMQFNRARYYDAAIGRFISEDPIGFADGVNVYAYVSNMPVNRRDPTGLFSIPLGFKPYANKDGSYGGWQVSWIELWGDRPSSNNKPYNGNNDSKFDNFLKFLDDNMIRPIKDSCVAIRNRAIADIDNSRETTKPSRRPKTGPSDEEIENMIPERLKGPEHFRERIMLFRELKTKLQNK